MKTYNTYQEAKIAHQNSLIMVRDSCFDAMENIATSQISRWEECEPADYCVTSEEFLKDGYAFVAGDFIFNSISQEVYRVDEIDCIGWNTPGEYDKVRYVLRASALDKPETTEWKNGDECLVENAQGYVVNGELEKHVGSIGVVRASFETQGGVKMVAVQHCSGDCVCWREEMLSKPESPEEKEKRERLEAAYDLYINTKQSMEPCMSKRTFIRTEGVEQDFWLRIVDKTNYRKGE